MNAWAAVDVMMLLEDLLNQGCNSGVFSLTGTRLALFPGIRAALGDVQARAERLNSILMTVFCDELIFYIRLREKMPIA